MKYLLLAAMLWLQLHPAYAQFNCGTDAIDQVLRANSPEYNKLRLKADSIMNATPASAQQTTNGSSALVVNGVHYIPVVVHIIHTGEAVGTQYNPTDQQVMDYINMLNQSFSGTYPGYPQAGSGGQNVTIQFALAQRTPDCNPTNGIVRKNASTMLSPSLLGQYISSGVNFLGQAGIPYEDMIAVSHWPNLEYYNIYLVRNVYGAGGFAYYPTGTSTIYDASVVNVSYVTNANPNPNVIAHELGHGFYLYHTFHNAAGAVCAPNANCVTEGDQVCDTEPHLENTNGCAAAAINPCTSQPYGNVVNNYMSYSCSNHFTAGQKTRMLNTLANLRAPLDASLGATSFALVPPTPQMGTPTISISTPQTTYCAGGVAVFNATTTYAGVSPTYQWKVNGVNAGLNYPAFSTTTLNTGDVVSCVLTSSYNASCITTNTATSNSIAVTVNNNPLPTVTLTTAATTVCAYTQVTYTATATNIATTPMPIFEWYINGYSAGTTMGTGATGTFSTYPANGDVVSCKVIAGTPCSPNMNYFSNSLTMTVNPSLSPTLTITANDSSICAGGTVTLSATYTNGGTTPPTITWYIINSMAGSIGSGSGPFSVVINDTCDIFALLTVNNTGGQCYFQTAAGSSWLPITADTVLPASVTVTTPNTSFCPGSLVNFTATPVNGGINPAYNWMVNSSSSTGATTAGFSHVPDDNDVITCQLNSSYACVTGNPALSNSITMQEADTVAATITYLQGAGSLCEGDTITLAAAYANLDTNVITSRQWLVNGMPESNSDTMVYVLDAGDNAILFTAGFQYTPHCMTINPVEYFADTATATPQPAAPVITDLGTHFGSNYPNGQNQWYEVSTGILAGETDQLFYPSISGFYYVTATVNGCTSKPSDTLQYIDPNSVGGLDTHEASFYPNPSSTGEFITPSHLIGHEAVITNSIGAVVLNVKLDKRVSLPGVASGVYFVRVVSQNFSRSYRLVISR